MAKQHQPRPVFEWELPQLQAGQGSESDGDEGQDLHDDEDDEEGEFDRIF